MHDNVFQKKLTSVMKDNLYDRVIPKRRAGKLDFNNAWRVHVGAKNVFQSKQERKNKEYNVVFCLDESGSMEGYKLDTAKSIMTFLTRILGKSGVNFAVVGYNCNVVVHKGFDKGVSPEEMEGMIMENFESKIIHHVTKEPVDYVALQGNHDWLALDTAYRLLKGRKHGKILIMLSDGRPKCDNPGRCGYPVKLHSLDVMRSLVKGNGDVISIGVGIRESNHLHGVFDEVVEVNDLNEFKNQMIALLNKKIKRG